jgi:hypothetical protein
MYLELWPEGQGVCLYMVNGFRQLLDNLILGGMVAKSLNVI